MVAGLVAEIWRYPVMGMQGETLEKATVSTEGVEGDHLYVLRDRSSGRILDPKSLAYAWGETKALPSMMDLKAELHVDSDGDEELRIRLPDGVVHSSKGGDLDRVVSQVLGHQVELLKYPRVVEARVRSGRTLHLLTDASLRAMTKSYRRGHFDVRRFRPNVLAVVFGREGFEEENWLGRTVTFGQEVSLRVEKPNTRCKVTTMKQGQLEEDPRILETVEKHNQNKLGVMCSVAKGGSLRVREGLALAD